LTPRELSVYRQYVEANKPALAPSTAAGFFQLYLRGHSCEEIAALNPAFGLGIIVKAKVDFNWDQQRLEHFNHLMENVRQGVQTTQMEAVQFLSEGLAVYRKLAGQKFQRYLQSGKEEDLGDFKDMSFKTFKEMMELMLKVTGAEPPRKSQVEHTHVVAPLPVATVALPDRPASSTEVHDFLKRVK